MGCPKITYDYQGEGLEKSPLKVFSRLGEKNDSPNFCIDYSPFGLTFNSYKTGVENKYKFQGQEHIDDLDLNWVSFKWRNHNPEIGRFFNVDPLAESYYYNSPYAFSENKVTTHIELEGLEAIYIFDQPNNPDDKSQAGAEIYVEHKNGNVNGPYQGSSYPNNKSEHNTVSEGTHPYNNKAGHKGSSKQGLNIVDAKGSRENTPTATGSKDSKMKWANVHEMYNSENRGSEGCPTVCPDDFGGFMSNFDLSGSVTVTNEDGTTTYTGTTGTSEDEVTIYRGDSEAATNEKGSLQMRQQFNRSLTVPEAKKDATNVSTNRPIFLRGN